MKHLTQLIHGTHRCLLLFVVCFLAFAGHPAWAYEEIHPSILYTAEEAAVIKDRLDREPYAAWFDSEIIQAQSILTDNITWGGSDVPLETQAYYARTLAFVYTFSEASLENRDLIAEGAARALYAVPSGSYSSKFNSDLEMSEAAVFYAATYDILKGAGYDFTVDGIGDIEPTFRTNFGKLRDYMAKDYYGLSTIAWDFPSVYYGGNSQTDNHHVKLYSALTVMSLAIMGEPGSSSDFDDVLPKLRGSLGNMTVTGDDGSPAGGWAEGPNYHLYSAQQYLTAVGALERNGIAEFYTDYPELVNTHMMLPHMLMPDGYMPPMDDNEAVIFDLAGLLYSHHDDRPERDMLLWMWDAGGRKMNSAFRVDYISQFDDTTPVYDDPVEMELQPTAFYPESGFARFRNSWDSDSIYMLLLGEHGEARVNGQAHEHPDPNAVILHAYGEMLLLDSGYGGWSAHDKTRYSTNHNIILVNGEGPTAAAQDFLGHWDANGADATISDSFTSNAVDYAVSQSLYLNTNFLRHVVFSGQDHFYLYDTVETGVESAFTMLLHGNDGGLSGEFTALENGGVWTQGNAALLATTVGSASTITFATEDMSHAVYGRTPMLTHTVLKATQSGVSEKFLTLLFPYRIEDGAPEISTIEITGGTALRTARADTVEYGCLKSDGESLIITETASDIASDSDFFYCRVDPDTEPSRFFFINGTSVSSSSGLVAQISSAANLSVDYSVSGTIQGYVQSGENATLTFYNVISERVVFKGSEVAFASVGDTISFDISGDGAFLIELETGELLPPADAIAYDYPDDNGHSMGLSWTLSPSESDGTVGFYRIYRSRSDTFANPKALSEFESLASLNEWDELNAALIDSVAAGVSGYIDTAVPSNNISYYYWIEAAGSSGASEKIATGTATSVESRPPGFALSAPSPNPFNAFTTIRFELFEPSRTELTVYDILGRKIRTLETGMLDAGIHTRMWGGLDSKGSEAGSGVYLILLRAGDRTAREKAVLMR